MGRIMYIPERGDIVKLNLSPTRGHEQSGYRPMLIITPKKLNRQSGLATGCPITSNIRRNPFEVIINTPKVRGAVLVDQVRTIDWTARKVKYVGEASHEILQDVCYKLELLIKGE